jgi:hypothetical protein
LTIGSRELKKGISKEPLVKIFVMNSNERLDDDVCPLSNIQFQKKYLTRKISLVFSGEFIDHLNFHPLCGAPHKGWRFIFCPNVWIEATIRAFTYPTALYAKLNKKVQEEAAICINLPTSSSVRSMPLSDDPRLKVSH